MNYIDLVLLSICIYGLVKGYINGLVKEITGTLSLFISFYVASSFYTFFDPYFSNYISEGPVKSLVVFGVLFLLLAICCRFSLMFHDLAWICIGFNDLAWGFFGFLWFGFDCKWFLMIWLRLWMILDDLVLSFIDLASISIDFKWFEINLVAVSIDL